MYPYFDCLVDIEVTVVSLLFCLLFSRDVNHKNLLKEIYGNINFQRIARYRVFGVKDYDYLCNIDFRSSRGASAMLLGNKVCSKYFWYFLMYSCFLVCNLCEITRIGA